jgi:DNA polymerase/3'-5' exonuclease PolX
VSEGMKVPYADAKKIADDLLVLLGNHFQRLQIAGSLRRKKEFVGDIELVGIPHAVLDPNSFWATPISPIGGITSLMKTFGYKAEKTGEKYIKFVSSHGMNVDLFMCTPETWGCIFMIRTGSAEFTRKMVTHKFYGGWCPNRLCFSNGRLLEYQGDVLVPLETPEESFVFDELGLAYVPPEQRTSQ